MTTLTYGQLARTPDAGEPTMPAVRASWTALARLAVLFAAVVAGGVAAHMLLDDPGVQATVIGAATGSAGAVVATLTAYLFVRRMHRTLALADAVLAATLTLVPGVTAVAALMPAVEATGDRVAVQVIATTAAGVVAALGLVAAATTRRRVLRDTRATDRVFCAALIASAVVFVGVAWLASSYAFDAGPQGVPSALHALVHVAAAVAAGAAAVAFFRAAASAGDPVVPWLVAAAAIAGAAQLTDALLPQLSGDTPGGAGLVQVAGWLALLIGGIRDFEWAHRRDAEDAVLDERRRLARELHDGLAQELAYITTETRRLADHPGAAHLAAAAERALEESRAAILALTRPSDEPLDRTIAVAAHSLGARSGVDVTVAVRPGLEAPPEVRQALLRILREAMGNAIRHGHARTVRISLDGPSPLVMAVADDGEGFDLGAARRPDSLGLQSMHERAVNLGGRVSIESVAGEGTTVALVLP